MTDNADLKKLILKALEERTEWETKQQAWYQLRHSGIRRRNKPYPGAPDMHVPLVDSTIDKQKPFYVQQVYATEKLASFVSLSPQQDQSTSDVGAWFDYKVKQESNFEREIICAIDTALQDGGGPIKCFWNNRHKRLEFDACDPLHVIVPSWTEELQEADFLVHVLHLSEAQYRSNPLYNQDDEFIKRIKGRGTNDGGSAAKEQEKDSREGITYGKDEEIVLWECYRRGETNPNEITILTRSPLCFEEQVRGDFRFSYTEGVFQEGWFPFVKLRTEIKDKGYYASRGIAEILAPFEQYSCKTQNTIATWQDFFSQPQFEEVEGQTVGNTGNFKSGPGSIVPKGLRAVQPPSIPQFLFEELNRARDDAEHRVSTPDFGVLNDIGGHRTATEISAIAGQTGQGSDLRARIFRLDLGDIYRMAWAIYLQFSKESVNFILNGEPNQIDPQALHDNYRIVPNGSADSWNKGAQMQKAVARFNMFKGSPYIKQGDLTKTVLENDDPGLVARLYQEPLDAQLGQQEEQAMELAIMELGFPAVVESADDDKTHLVTMTQYFEQKQRNGEPIRPRTARLALKHGSDHTNALLQKKDPAARQINKSLLPMIQILSQIAAQPDPAEIAAQAQLQNVVPMQQQPQVAQPLAPVNIPALQPQTQNA